MAAQVAIDINNSSFRVFYDYHASSRVNHLYFQVAIYPSLLTIAFPFSCLSHSCKLAIYSLAKKKLAIYLIATKDEGIYCFPQKEIKISSVV